MLSEAADKNDRCSHDALSICANEFVYIYIFFDRGAILLWLDCASKARFCPTNKIFWANFYLAELKLKAPQKHQLCCVSFNPVSSLLSSWSIQLSVYLLPAGWLSFDLAPRTQLTFWPYPLWDTFTSTEPSKSAYQLIASSPCRKTATGSESRCAHRRAFA